VARISSYTPVRPRYPDCRQELAHQPLRQDRHQRRSDQIGEDAHLRQPGDGARRIVGVKRAEHEVPGLGRLEDDMRGLAVLDQDADHHLLAFGRGQGRDAQVMVLVRGGRGSRPATVKAP
jgi:hypothetical protein